MSLSWGVMALGSLAVKIFSVSTIDKPRNLVSSRVDGLASSLFRPRRFALPRAAGFFCWDGYRERRLHHRELPAAERPGGRAVSRATPATCRSSTTTATCRREQVAEDHRFENLTQIWLSGDHYKWRAMRATGVAERYCTGDASRLGEVPEMGRDRAADAAQSALPLDAPGTEAAASASATGCSARRRPRASGTSATRSWPGRSSPAAASCGR